MQRLTCHKSIELKRDIARYHKSASIYKNILLYHVFVIFVYLLKSYLHHRMQNLAYFAKCNIRLSMNTSNLLCASACTCQHYNITPRTSFASHDCPLLEHSIHPQTHRGQWPPLRAIATRPWHLTNLVVRYVSSNTIRTIFHIP